MRWAYTNIVSPVAILNGTVFVYYIHMAHSSPNSQGDFSSVKVFGSPKGHFFLKCYIVNFTWCRFSGDILILFIQHLHIYIYECAFFISFMLSSNIYISLFRGDELFEAMNFIFVSARIMWWNCQRSIVSWSWTHDLCLTLKLWVLSGGESKNRCSSSRPPSYKIDCQTKCMQCTYVHTHRIQTNKLNILGSVCMC